eukprot:6109512-Pleurochrysis_carterae.AAC.2
MCWSARLCAAHVRHVMPPARAACVRDNALQRVGASPLLFQASRRADVCEDAVRAEVKPLRHVEVRAKVLHVAYVGATAACARVALHVHDEHAADVVDAHGACRVGERAAFVAVVLVTSAHTFAPSALLA